MDRRAIDATLETLRLKEESRLMEERLAMLKNLMKAEKASRRAASSAFWASGQKGPLKKQYASEQQKVVVKSPRRIKILTDNNEDFSNAVPSCDKCGKYRPSVSCLECAENYCSACFIRLHQNGELANHHASPILQQTNSAKQRKGNKHEEVSSHTVDDYTYKEPSEHCTENQGGSLLQGTYDEDASAASFQEALQEWRAGQPSKGHQEQQTTSDRDNSTAPRVSTEVQSTPPQVAPNTIEFRGGGVSYLEKLMIRSHRIDPSFLHNLREKKPPSGRSLQETGDCDASCVTEQEPSQYNIFYSADGDLQLPSSDELYKTELFDVQPCPPLVEEIHFPVENKFFETTDQITTATITPSSPCITPKSGHAVFHRAWDVARNSPSKAPKVNNDARSEHNAHTLPLGGVAASLPLGCLPGNQQDVGHETLSGFFLSEVEPHPSKSLQHQSSPHHTPSQQSPCSNERQTSGDHSSQFRLGAVIWLPDNSRLPTNGEPPEKIDLVLPLPSPVPSSKCQAQVPENGDDSSQDGDISNDVCSVQDLEEVWDDGDDLEAIESLAWELSSNTDGRITQSSIQDEDGCQGENLQIKCAEDMANATSISTISVDQVMEQFDLYQKLVMNQES